MRSIILVLLCSCATRAAAACAAPPDLPRDPVQDNTIQSPRSSSTRIITRAANSILVDLKHPGGPTYDASAVEDCPHDQTNLTAWSDVMPIGTGQDVELPLDTRVLLSCDSLQDGETFGKITIPVSSELIFDDAPIDIVAHGIEVLGALRAGSETCRLQSFISITLYGDRPATIYDGQATWYKGIDVNQGTLEIHSTERARRVRLHRGSPCLTTPQVLPHVVAPCRHGQGGRQHASSPGPRQLGAEHDHRCDHHAPQGLSRLVGLRQLKTKDADIRRRHQNEEVRVDAVAGAGHLGESITAVYLQSALKYTHYGGEEYQAEVGLLTRRFVIQGDINSEPTDISPIRCSGYGYTSYPCGNSFRTGFGAHVIIQNQGALAKVSGVEFFRVGQTNFDGRYPIHWHMVDDGKGSFVRDSSFHRSYFRCVTLHGTNEVLVSRNVAFGASTMPQSPMSSRQPVLRRRRNRPLPLHRRWRGGVKHHRIQPARPHPHDRRAAR